MNGASPSRRWTLLATALAGQALQVRQTQAAGPAWAGSAAADTVDLPALGTDDERRLAVLRHALDLQAGGRWRFRCDEALARGLIGPRAAAQPASDIERCLASWPRPVLLRRLWFTLDRLRVDAQIRLHYAGARALLPASLPRPPAALPHPVLLQLQSGVDAQATVYDSLRAALAWCAWLQAAQPGRSGRLMAALDRASWPEAATGPAPDGLAGPGHASAEADPDGSADAHAGAAGVLPATQGQPPAGGHDQAAPALPPGAGAKALPAPQPGAGRLPARSLPLDPLRRRHDEWDYQLQAYRRGWTCVHERSLPATELAFRHDLLQRHAGLARLIRRRFSIARPAWRERVRAALDGDQLDLDAAIASVVNRRAGLAPDGRVHIAHPPARRDVCAALLLDMSGSTGHAIPDPAADDAAAQAATDNADEDRYFHAPPRRLLPPPRLRRRVIDVARDAIGLMCEGLHGLGDRHAVFGFTGQGREQVEFHVAKSFAQTWSAQSAAPLAAMQPGGATRTGAAIRHALWHLARETARRRVLIVVTDGYPQDSDYGDDPDDIDYGLHDTAQALREAARAGVVAFCISVDAAAHDHLRRMCPPQRYLVINDVRDLPQRLVQVYRQLTLR